MDYLLSRSADADALAKSACVTSAQELQHLLFASLWLALTAALCRLMVLIVCAGFYVCIILIIIKDFKSCSILADAS